MAIDDLPDGYVVQSAPDSSELPDGYVLQGQNNAPATTQMAGPARLPLMGGMGALKGLGEFVSTPGDVAQLYESYVGAPFARAMTGQAPQFGVNDPRVSSQMASVLPPSSKTLGDLKSLGLIDRQDLQPQKPSEQLLSSTAEGIGSNIPLAVLGGPLTAAKTLIQGAGAGLGSGLAQQVMPNSPMASLLGSLTGGSGAAGMANLGERAVNSLTDNSSPILQAYKEAGVTPRLVGDVSQNPTMQGIQATAGKLPFGSNQVKKAADQTLNEFGNSVQNTADMFGNSHTLQEAGTAIQQNGKQWLSDFNRAKQDAWDNVDSLIGKTTPVPTANTRNAVFQIIGSAQGNQALNDLLKSPTTQSAINILQEGKGNLTWGQMAALRTHIGQTLENPMLISGPEQAQSKMLYGALTKDMQNGAFSTGSVKALNAFQNANAMTMQGHDFIENVLGDVMKADPEKAASKLLSSAATGGTQLQALRREMPDAADQLAAVSIRRMGAGESNGGAGNTVSPLRWLSSQDPTRRMSPEAYQALFADPLAQKKLNALDTVADSMRSTEKLVNHSNTGTHLATLASISAPFEGAAYGLHSDGLRGALIGFGAGSIPLGLGIGAGAMSTNPALARFMGSSVTPYQFGALPSLLPQISKYQQQQSEPYSFAPAAIPFSLAPQGWQ